jgi:hypothetical protein
MKIMASAIGTSKLSTLASAPGVPRWLQRLPTQRLSKTLPAHLAIATIACCCCSPMGQGTSAALSELTSQEVADFVSEQPLFASYARDIVAHELDGKVCAALHDDEEMLVLVLDTLLVPAEQRAALIQHMQSFSQLIAVDNGGSSDKHSRKHTDTTLSLTPRGSAHSGAVSYLPSGEHWSSTSIEVRPVLYLHHAHSWVLGFNLLQQLHCRIQQRISW